MSDLAATIVDVIVDVDVIPDAARDVDVTITVAVIITAELPCLETVETAAPVSFGSSV